MWRIRIDATEERLALEVRDADVLLAYFYTFNIKDHRIDELKLQQHITWWQGLEDAHDGLVLLHGYADRQLGQHKGITALNATSGNMQWEQPELAFYGIASDGLFAYLTADPEADFSLIASSTGKNITDYVPQQEAIIAIDSYSLTRYSKCTYPMLYLQGGEYFSDLQVFLQQQLDVSVIKAIEYAEAGACFVASYYVQAGSDKLDNFVVVFDLEGHLLLQVQLGGSLDGIGSDTFFIFKDELYLIRNKNLLQVYKLPI
ncbi:DUF4905 domain-containing protein [Pontibacter silvestris]|uniref:DUF4905 domain-containing protein n=1 Tax=Pontibacter silvestris TaxID=2305183 RepID=A0ABW4WXI2_9BACT|nr:DUF4905 domain-containing protein [Pontibacter silvestris]MCC9138366.1 DUF4905 domain-containing protein [Pontibacter silvestris]